MISCFKQFRGDDKNLIDSLACSSASRSPAFSKYMLIIHVEKYYEVMEKYKFGLNTFGIPEDVVEPI